MTRPSGARSAVRFAVAVALYAGAGRWLPLVLAWMVQAVVLTGMYSAMHEAAHRHLFTGRRANRVAGVLAGATILVDFSLYRTFHLQHHATTASADDPEPTAELRRLGSYLGVVVVAGPAFVVGLLVDLARTALGRQPRYVRTVAQRRAVLVDGLPLLAALAVAAVGLVLAPGPTLAWWLVPLAVTYSLPFIVTALPEHHGCDETDDPLGHTRTVRSNRLFRFLYWNNNFHAEHHLAPSVAYHRLPELHRHLEGRHRHLSRSYTAFHAGLVRSLLAKAPR